MNLFVCFSFFQNLGKNIRLLVMNNLLPSSIRMHQKYDLKGSTYKRRASKHEKIKPSPTLKDLDFMEDHPDGLEFFEKFQNMKSSIFSLSGIYLEAGTYDAMMKTISRDCLVRF